MRGAEGHPDIRFLGLRRVLPRTVDAQALFAALTGSGTREGCVLLQSSDNIPKYGERSFGAVGASAVLRGRDDAFELRALDAGGRALLPALKRRLPAVAHNLRFPDEATIAGRVKIDRSSVSGRLRPLRRNLMDVLRAVAFCAPPEEGTSIPAYGWFGAFAYSFVHQYENFDRPPHDVLDEPDMLFYLATRMFIIDHAGGATHLVRGVPVVHGRGGGEDSTDVSLPDLLLDAERDLNDMQAAAEHLARSPRPVPAGAGGPSLWRVGPMASDTSFEHFCANVRSIQREIVAGRVFQTVYGRMLSAAFDGSPFDVYARLCGINPSPYMFYLNTGDGVLLAASPEMAVRVTREPSGRRVELRPIAGTKPRGWLDGHIDPLTDAKYEIALKIDPKELAEHTMLVDLARNDLASICRPGTVVVDEPFTVEKYSHVQHLVSNVSGFLRDDLDALHAYLATMNMGTVTGAPKLEAMKMIHELERSARGFFGGGVGYILPDGNMDTALVIRAMRFKQGKVYLRAAAGIVADSAPEAEWEETENKAAASLRVLAAQAGRGAAEQ